MYANETEGFSRLVQAIDPGATLLRHWPLAGGVSAQTSALQIRRANGDEERFVVRVHGPRDLARDPEIAQHEFQLLDALRKAGIPVPAPVAVDDSGAISRGPAIVVEFVEGDIVTATNTPSRFASDLAYWLVRIHEFDLSSVDLSFLVASDYHAAWRFEPRPDDPPLVQRICEVLGKVGPVEFHNPDVLLHGDFWRGNLLWKDGGLAAILDWEDAMIGDPIIDLARSRLEIHWTLGELARERFTSHYQSYRDIDIDDLPFWDLAMALGFARDLRYWGLDAARQHQMEQALERFVDQAIGQLRLYRGYL